MSNPRIGSRGYFRKGIDEIVFQGYESGLTLPRQRELPPVEDPFPPRLDQLLAFRGMENYLEDGIRPEFTDRELLLPAVFRQVMENTRAHLQEVAARQRGRAPAEFRKLRLAVELLDEEMAHRELLRMYMHALLQG